MLIRGLVSARVPSKQASAREGISKIAIPDLKINCIFRYGHLDIKVAGPSSPKNGFDTVKTGIAWLLRQGEVNLKLAATLVPIHVLCRRS